MAVQIPFPLPSSGFALNSKMRINLDFLVDQFNQFNTGTATWDTVGIGVPNSETGTLTFWNASNVNYLTFQAGATSTNTTFTWPTGVPSASRKFLTSTTGGVMSWSTLSEAASYTGNLLVYTDASAVLQELAVGSGNKVLVNSTPPSYFSLLGTTSQVIVTPGVGNFTLSLPQSIATSSNVIFNSVQTDGGSATSPGVRVIASGASTNTGIWSPSGTELDLTVAGATRLSIDNTGLAVATSEFRAATLRATTQLNLSTSTSHILTMQMTTGGSVDYSILWPNTQGGSNTVLKNDGSGNLSWVSVSVAGGATIALDNLSAVAVNSTIKPGVNSSLDFGAIAKNWVDIYFSGALKNGSTTLATNTEVGYLTGVTSAIQTQLGTKAPSASPSFTGTVNMAGLSISLPVQTDASKNLISAAIDLSTPQVTGNLGVSHLNSGTSASATTFWCGDATWKGISAAGGATKALDNLASTAVNVNILPGSADAVDLGSGSLPFLNFYTGLIQIGRSGFLGHFTLYPGTASRGNLAIVPVDNAGNTTTTLTYASQAAARTYTIPDAGAAAAFVMTEGTQTINGTKSVGGTLLVGPTSTNTIGTISPSFQIEGTGAAGARPSVTLNVNSAAGAQLQIAKTRGASNGTYTIVQNGDFIGGISWLGANGVDLSAQGAYIFASISGTPSATSMPTQLDFATTPAGAVGASVGLSITSAQVVKFYASATGSTTALLATANCPAVSGTAPFVWLKFIAPDGSTVYVPGWK